MKKTQFVTRSVNPLIWLMLLLALPMFAQANIIRVATLDVESNFKINSDDYVIHKADIEAANYFEVGTNFSLLGESLFTSTFNAPKGMRFRATFAQAGSLGFIAKAGSRTTIAGRFSSIDNTLSFTGFGGTPLPTLQSQIYITGPDTAFNTDSSGASVSASIAAGSDFWFESFTIQTQIPASFSTNLPGRTVSTMISASMRTDNDANYGQFLRLEAIPTNTPLPVPGSWLLLLLGGVMLRVLGRR